MVVLTTEHACREMTQPDLRRILSDELHARAFHDFDGAGGSFLCVSDQ